jgi:hypothetical protein
VRSKIFKVIGVIVGLFFAYSGFSERSNLNHIRSVGKIAIVQPIDSYTKRKSIYSAEFTFITEGGEKVTQRHSFPQELLKDFDSRTPVRVIYNPSNPREFIFEKESASWLTVVTGLGIAIAALIFA